MAFEIKNPTLKNIVDFLKNQLGSMSFINDAPNDSKKYGRKNGFWVEVSDSGGGGGGSTNIGDEVYTEGNQLIIRSSSTQIQDFFKNIAPEFDNTISHAANEIVMHDNQLYTLTVAHTAPAAWETTTHTTTDINEILTTKATTAYVDNEINKREVYIKTITSHNSANASYNDSNIEDDMIPIAMDLSNPSAATGDWTITTSNGSVNISGNITGSTNVTLYFMKSR